MTCDNVVHASQRRRLPVPWLCGAVVVGHLITAPAAAGDLTMIAHPPAEKSQHPPLIILLHGAGADEHDMIGLWHDLPKDIVVVSPRAPFRDPGGGWRWYRKGTRDADIAMSRKIVDLIVDAAVKRFDADPARVFLGGFSQGAVMTYEVALHEPGRVRGAVILSGSLFPSALVGLPPKTELARESFFIGHGTADQRIPFANAEAARMSLQRKGVPVDFHTYAGMVHTTDAKETQDLADWLSSNAK